MLTNKLDWYKGKGNKYVEDNIQEIQELYIEEEKKEEKGIVEDEEVILVKPYEVSMTLSSLRTSFITDKVKTSSSIWSLCEPHHKHEYSDHHHIIKPSDLEVNKILHSGRK